MSKNIGILLVISCVLSAIVASLLGVDLFSKNGVGWVIGYGMGTVLIAIILCGIPAGIFWLLNQKQMPKFNAAIWMVWSLVFALASFGNFA